MYQHGHRCAVSEGMKATARVNSDPVVEEFRSEIGVDAKRGMKTVEGQVPPRKAEGGVSIRNCVNKGVSVAVISDADRNAHQKLARPEVIAP